jgi:hypothetical protein
MPVFPATHLFSKNYDNYCIITREPIRVNNAFAPAYFLKVNVMLVNLSDNLAERSTKHYLFLLPKIVVRIPVKKDAAINPTKTRAV